MRPSPSAAGTKLGGVLRWIGGRLCGRGLLEHAADGGREQLRNIMAPFVGQGHELLSASRGRVTVVLLSILSSTQRGIS